jgi:hypothetical protein
LTIKINRQDIIAIIAISPIPNPINIALIISKKKTIEQNKRRIPILKAELSKPNPDIAIVEASIASAVK